MVWVNEDRTKVGKTEREMGLVIETHFDFVFDGRSQSQREQLEKAQSRGTHERF